MKLLMTVSNNLCLRIDDVGALTMYVVRGYAHTYTLVVVHNVIIGTRNSTWVRVCGGTKLYRHLLKTSHL